MPARHPRRATARLATRGTVGRRRADGRRPGAVADPAASAAARRPASPRCVNGGGWASSTVAPASTSCAPGSRSTTRSPGTSGSGAEAFSSVSRAWSAPSGRTRTAAEVVPTCRVACDGIRSQSRCSTTSTTAVTAGQPGDSSALPRGTARGGHGAQVDGEPGGAARGLHRLAVHLQAAHPQRCTGEQERVAAGHRPGGQRAGDDRAGAGDRERAVDPQAHRGGGIARGRAVGQGDQRGTHARSAPSPFVPTPRPPRPG